MSIFKDNDATRHYFSIIESAKDRFLVNDRLEKHHVIPDSFFINNRAFRKTGKTTGWLEGDPNDSSNIVHLTYKEHIQCHLLLPNMVEKGSDAYRKMIAAVFWMLRKNKISDLSDEEKIEAYARAREANRLTAKRRMEDGTHHFLNVNWRKDSQDKMRERGTHIRRNKEKQKELSQRAMANGNHVFFGGEFQKKLSERRMQEGTHNAVAIHTCPWCGTASKGFVIFRYHFDNCKKNPSYKGVHSLKDAEGRLLKKDGTPQKKRGPKPSLR
jgi:hypothetical protein